MIITEDYKELNRKLHEADPEYGTSGAKWRDFIRYTSDYGRMDILDFGCGKCTLAEALGPAYSVTHYDPCIPEFSSTPEPHDAVACTDVMEHVEPELVDSVLKEIRRLTRKRAFFAIAMHPALKVLEDGRNAHLTIRDRLWWTQRLADAGFEIEKQSDDTWERKAWFVVH